MKISTLDLQDAVNTVSKALPKKAGTIPVVSNILLDGDRVTATNLEILVSTPLKTEGEKILLPHKTVEIVNSLPGAETEIVVDEPKVTIKSGKSKFTLYTDGQVDDFPTPKQLDSAKVEVDGEEFFTALKSVLFATSLEETRPAFTGVKLDLTDKLRLQASDTYRLAVNEMDTEGEEFTALIPGKALRELIKLHQPQTITIQVDHSTAVFNLDGTIFQARLLEESFPDTSGVIPKEHKTIVTGVDVGQLSGVLKRALLVSDSKKFAVKITGEGDTLTVNAEGQTGKMDESIPATIEGEEISVIINAKYLQEALGYGIISMEFNGDGGAVILRDDNKYLHLILPIKKTE